MSGVKKLKIDYVFITQPHLLIKNQYFVCTESEIIRLLYTKTANKFKSSWGKQ